MNKRQKKKLFKKLYPNTMKKLGFRDFRYLKRVILLNTPIASLEAILQESEKLIFDETELERCDDIRFMYPSMSIFSPYYVMLKRGYKECLKEKKEQKY